MSLTDGTPFGQTKVSIVLSKYARRRWYRGEGKNEGGERVNDEKNEVQHHHHDTKGAGGTLWFDGVVVVNVVVRRVVDV